MRNSKNTLKICRIRVSRLQHSNFYPWWSNQTKRSFMWPDQRISFLWVLFNIIFVAGYSLVWPSAKSIMLFKKGLRKICEIYRWISVVVYDDYLVQTLSRTAWFSNWFYVCYSTSLYNFLGQSRSPLSRWSRSQIASEFGENATEEVLRKDDGVEGWNVWDS